MPGQWEGVLSVGGESRRAGSGRRVQRVILREESEEHKE